MESHARSATGNHAATWMLESATKAEMSTDDFVQAMQLRCAHFNKIYTTCSCGFSFREKHAIESLTHLLTCADNSYSYLSRHDEIVTSLNRVLRAWGFNTFREPTMFAGESDDKRQDIAIFTTRLSPVLDVSVVTNTSESHCFKNDPASEAAAHKRTKHEANVVSKGAYKFYPVILETSGNIHNDFDTLIRHLQQHLPIGSAKEFRRDMCFAASVALQRGNARIIRHAYGRLESMQTFARHNFV